MRNIWSITVMVVLALLLAACGSSNEAEPLPTMVVLPTLPETTSEAAGDTTQPTTAPSEAAATEEAPTTAPRVVGPTPLPTKEPTESAPPFEGILPPGAATEDTDQAVSGQNSPQGGALPFGARPTWVVQSTQPVNIYECIEEGCAILASVSNGTQVLMIEEGEAWHNIQLDDLTGFVEAGSLVPVAQVEPTQQNPNLPPGFPPGLTTPGAQPPQGGTFSPPAAGFPPGVNPQPSTPNGPGGSLPFPPSSGS